MIPPLLRIAAAACIVAAACGPRSLSVNSAPFPAGKPVFAPAGGAPARELPPAQEPARLVLLDFPWCSACADVWGAVRAASRSVAAGKVRVYRVVFDRERLFEGASIHEVPPLRPAPPPDAGAFPVTTLSAIPRAFLEEYRVERVPVLLLLDARGRIGKRWNGFSPALPADIAAEVNRLLGSPLPPGT